MSDATNPVSGVFLNDQGMPIVRTGFAIDETTGERVATFTSAADGAFTFYAPSLNPLILILRPEPGDGRNAVVLDRIIPMVSGNSNSFDLDRFSSNLEVTYSLRRLLGSYSGACLRVRRDSDNLESDISFVNGQLDTNSLLSFVNSASGYVSVWYDQSGNANNCAQNQTSRQPKLVTSGSYLGKLVFDGIDDNMLSINTCSISSSKSFACRANLLSNNVTSVLFRLGDGNVAADNAVWFSPRSGSDINAAYVSADQSHDGHVFASSISITTGNPFLVVVNRPTGQSNAGGGLKIYQVSSNRAGDAPANYNYNNGYTSSYAGNFTSERYSIRDSLQN